MPSSRVYVGHLPSRASRRDVEHFFRGFGSIREIVLKENFGFVEFDDYRDAEDAVHDMNGREMFRGSERLVVEMSRNPSRGGGGGYGSSYGGSSYGGRSGNSRYGPPVQTRHRLIIENLTTRVSWQDLKDMFRRADCEVTYADAHKPTRHEGIVCFDTREDMKRAMRKLQGEDVNGRRIRLVDDSERRSRSRSRRRSRTRSRSRSRDRRSRSRSHRRSRSRSRSRERRSRSRSNDRRSKSRDSRSRTRSPYNNNKGENGGSRSRSPSNHSNS